MSALNFLLIMPRFVTRVGDGYSFQLGIAYVSAAMKQAGFNVFTLNLNHIEGETDAIISNEITKNKIDLVMTGGLSVHYNILKSIVDCVHDNFPRIKIIIGGGIITADPEVAMTALEHADIGVIGEGEVTAVELCNTLQENIGESGVIISQLSEIAGIIYKNDRNWTRTKARKEIDDLDSLPFPDWDGFELSRYLELPPRVEREITKERSFLSIGARSCPYQCTFCFHTTGKRYRKRSMDNVAKEIEMLVKYNVTCIIMLEELFGKHKDRVQIMGNIAKKHGIAWSACFRVDDIDENMVEILKHGNCISIGLGLESADNRILKSMRKNITMEQTEKALKLLYDAGVVFSGNFIFGDIEETFETANITLDWWEKHKHYNILINFINTYPGTYIYKYALQNGIIKDPVRFLQDGCPQVNISKLSEDELSLVARKMLLLSAEAGLTLEQMEHIALDNKDRISFGATCIKCGKKQIFKDVILFVGSTFVHCADCKQQYIIHLPEELAQILFVNLQNHINENGKTGLWGITGYTLPLFENNDIFKDEKIIFMDNAAAKQMIKIHGKTVHSPDELLAGEIDTVIFFYPRSYSIVAEEIKRKYPKVKRFINVYDLLAGQKS
ncbi:MAG: radical SAM protein [Betaproteobacteria bacterium]|nr:radical SAM protein [Betaproteobacteria bacterium]